MRLTILLIIIGLIGYIINSGPLGRTNIIKLFISIEIMLLGVTLLIILSGYNNDDILGLIIGIIVLIITGIESAIGLTILVNYYKIKGSLPTNI
uniref:NADH-ubiquinone oxidoreductase chain 4L n=1 Tax=Wickerhamomyces canadensis TaxID=1156965 RepID=NU4LM_WICCA|nr:NADH dehydrogenase subunit 4L [Wickerhamomyces canadensis]Q36903.2 RecName: Full=NADH-ubiquinone oxidoreductase chain 4L; AltName: Full=NADH dehydrogenase subunit 4L [Wickerhamomyces canadensis]BAA03778.2 NADH dehydrogenase subunit 4L [Wickerhamomyces canadensis]BAA06570.2 NADH dehydrogenase subunit 4L [Wickerhamomyces canadensis]